MTDTDQKREDAVLRQMLKTPPQPHKVATKRVNPKVTRPKNDRVTPITD